MIVVDASVVLEALLRTLAGRVVQQRLFATGQTLHTPPLLDVEVAQVLRRYVAGRAIDVDRGGMALNDLTDLPITRYPHDVLLSRIWALRDDLTAYDAAYVAVAEGFDAPLVTCNRRLAGAPGHCARIETVP